MTQQERLGLDIRQRFPNGTSEGMSVKEEDVQTL